MELNENERYNVVTSVGVIHHLSNPKMPLANVANLIKNDGILIIHVYHAIGEYERMLKRTIARTLQGDLPLGTGIRIMKELGYTLPINQYGLNGYNLNLTEDDVSSKDADVYLHPQVYTYLFEEGMECSRRPLWIGLRLIR
jgi:SAM-dependent methyltransferase